MLLEPYDRAKHVFVTTPRSKKHTRLGFQERNYFSLGSCVNLFCYIHVIYSCRRFYGTGGDTLPLSGITTQLTDMNLCQCQLKSKFNSPYLCKHVPKVMATCSIISSMSSSRKGCCWLLRFSILRREAGQIMPTKARIPAFPIQLSASDKLFRFLSLLDEMAPASFSAPPFRI